MDDTNETLPETAAGEVAPGANRPAISPYPATDVTPPSAIDVVIDNWFVDCIHNSPVARQTEIFNHCMAAKEELKRRIAAL